MADKNKLQFSFISLVLSVSGKVRPVDLQGIPESERAGALRAFYEANVGSMPLSFDGEELVRGGGAGPVSAMEPPAAQASAAPAPPAPEPVSDYSLASTPAAVPGFDAMAPAAPDVDFLPAPAAPAAPAPAAPALTDFDIPPVGDFGAPAAPAPALTDFDIPPVGDFATPAAPAPDFGAPAPGADFGATSPGSMPDLAPPAPMPPSADADWGQPVEPAAFDLPPEKVSFAYWVLPVLFTWLGGIVAYFLVRKKNPKQAKTMLLVGIVLTVVFVLAGVAAFFLGGLFAPAPI